MNGFQVPGLPEGLEILRIQDDEPAKDGEYGYPGLVDSLYKGAIVVRSLPGYSVRYNPYTNETVVVKHFDAPKLIVLTLQSKDSHDLALVGRCIEAMRASGIEVEEQP